MIEALIRFIRFVAHAATWYLAVAFARALHIRLPPRNYLNRRTPRSTSSGDEKPGRTPFVLRRKAHLRGILDDDDDTPSAPRALPLEPLELVDTGSSPCTPVCSPRKAFRYTTSPSPIPLKSESFNMAMLRAASDHISDILQERRRRVDAGEDPCLKRKEARRRRTEELVLFANSF